MPGYIGSLVGFDDKSSLFYAKDHKGTATVSITYYCGYSLTRTMMIKTKVGLGPISVAVH